MRDYKSGKWGFSLVWGIQASVFPRAFVTAVPNAILAFLVSWYRHGEINSSFRDDDKVEAASSALTLLATFTTVLFFILKFRSNIAYDRWWEGGTLLQKTRGEWFNSYSSIIAFSSPDPTRAAEVESFHHMLARLMSMLFCAALQQVSPDKDRSFEIIHSEGLSPESMEWLNHASDKVEVILQWIQRSVILGMQSGVLPIPPPVMSRAFQEVSRGIVNLQNARKIADFPFPFPYAQTSMVMLLIHWATCPILTSYMLPNAFMAAVLTFLVSFFLWCINFIALQLEQPFGCDDNDLPMDQMQRDWNKSLGTLLTKRGQTPPNFTFDGPFHRKLEIILSNGEPAPKARLSMPMSIPRTLSVAKSMSSLSVEQKTNGAVSIKLSTKLHSKRAANTRASSSPPILKGPPTLTGTAASPQEQSSLKPAILNGPTLVLPPPASNGYAGTPRESSELTDSCEETDVRHHDAQPSAMVASQEPHCASPSMLKQRKLLSREPDRNYLELAPHGSDHVSGTEYVFDI